MWGDGDVGVGSQMPRQGEGQCCDAAPKKLEDVAGHGGRGGEGQSSPSVGKIVVGM